MAQELEAVPHSDSSVALPVPRVVWPIWVSWRALAGGTGLVVLFVAVGAVAVFAANAPGPLVWSSATAFPGWVAGPLHGLLGRVPHTTWQVLSGYSALLAVMLGAYGLALAGARAVSMGAIWAFTVAVCAVLVLSPPLQLTDLFNYLGYARLWGLHGLNPYTHVIANERFDPVSILASWHNWHSPYGTLFTALTYPLAWLPLQVAYWVMKVVTVLLGLVFVGLVAKCARLLGRDPRPAVVLIAANPIFLLYALGEFHNDFFMLVPMVGAIALLVSGRERVSGAALAAAAFVKFTAVLVAPFLLLAAGARRRFVGGLALAGLVLAGMSVAAFGPAFPNVSGQSGLLTAYSFPNLLGWGLGLGGGAPMLVKALELGVLVVAAHQFARGRDWIAGAGWATVALIVSLGWLMPWYVVWLLPLAALSSSVRLRRTAVALTVFLVVTFAPFTVMWMDGHGVNPLRGSAVTAAARAAAFRDER
jgi:hypothetical protein